MLLWHGGTDLAAILAAMACVVGCAQGSNSEDGDGETATTAATGGFGGTGGAGAGGTGGAGGGEGGAPPMCSEDPCKLTLPQCGCADGEACVLQSGGRGCAPAGDKAESEACADDCQAGHQCLANNSPILQTPSICMKWCENDDDCVGPGAICLFTVNGEDEKLCSINCDPISGAGCDAEGTKCDILRESMGAMRWLTTCAGVGPGTQEAPCTNTPDCAEGYGCFNVTDANMMTTQMCLRWCNTQMPTSCPANSQCASFQTPITVGALTFGACVPVE